jgi:uncharacterized SAM-binding protein YcdF (DUF218 family)
VYVVGKILGTIVVPSRIAVALVLVGVVLAILHRRRRLGVWLAAVGGVLLLVCSLPVVAGALASPLEGRWQPYRARPAAEGPRWIAVLGGGAGGGESLPAPSRLSRPSLVRMVEGLRVARCLPKARVVVSGGFMERASSTVLAIREALVELGLEPNRVMAVDGARTTAEEMAGLAMLAGSDELVLVTSALHMRRAVYLAESAGLRVVPAPCDFRAWGRADDGPWWGRWLPSPRALELTDDVAHEVLGRLWAKVMPAARPQLAWWDEA